MNSAKAVGLVSVALVVSSSWLNCWAQEPEQMAATTPFTQSKATDNSGHVSYRVGAVFAAQQDATRRLSMTFICEDGGKLSLYVVHTRVPQDKRKTPKVTLQVDSEPVLQTEVTRQIGTGLAAYTVANTPQVEALMKVMGPGHQLVLAVDDGEYSLSLEGLANELKDLAAVCPHGRVSTIILDRGDDGK